MTDGLAKSRSVILFNNAGIASSGGDPADTIEAMAKHVIAFVDALGLKRSTCSVSRWAASWHRT